MANYYRKNFISRNGYRPSTNRFVGRFAYFVFHGAVFLIAYKIWGIKMFDEIWFYVMHLAAFFSVKLFLLAIGFWVY